MNFFSKLALVLLLVFLNSCSTAGKNTRLLSPNDNVYDPVDVKYTKFIFEDSQFRVVGKSELGGVVVGFRQKDCDTGADNKSPYVCTFTVGKLKRFGCGEVNYIND